MKLLIEENESDQLAATIMAAQPDFVGCHLLETEVRRATMRYPELSQADATTLLEGVALHDMPAPLFREAGLITGTHLRSLDALHLVAAIRLDVNYLLTYDDRMIKAANDAGIAVLSPGRQVAGTDV